MEHCDTHEHHRALLKTVLYSGMEIKTCTDRLGVLCRRNKYRFVKCSNSSHWTMDSHTDGMDSTPPSVKAAATAPDRGPRFFPLLDRVFLGFFTIMTPCPFTPDTVLASLTARVSAVHVRDILNDAKVS